jgi:hypothetical protein
MMCLLSVDSVKADSVPALYCVWVNHNVADDSVDGSYTVSLRAPEFEYTASAGPTLT